MKPLFLVNGVCYMQVAAVREECNKNIDKMAEEIQKLEQVRETNVCIQSSPSRPTV